MPNCHECEHYREAKAARAPTQALRWLTSSPESQISQEFKRIAEEERRIKEVEIKREAELRQQCANLMHARQLTLTSKEPLPVERIAWFNAQVKPVLLRNRYNDEPRAVSHCAAHAAAGAWYLTDVKNWGGSCTDDFKPKPVVPECRTCSRYSRPDTEAKLRAEAQSLLERIPKHDRNSAQFFEKRAREIEQSIDPAKAQELRDAYDARGELYYRTDYLPACGVACSEHVKTGLQEGCPCCRFYQPEIFNQFLKCSSYEPAQRPVESSGASQRIRPESRQTEIDRMGFKPSRRSERHAELEQMAEDLMTAAYRKTAAPVRGAQDWADQFLVSVFQGVRTVFSGAQGRSGPGRCRNGHDNSTDRPFCDTCGERL